MTATARPLVRYLAQASAWAPKVATSMNIGWSLTVVDREAEVADLAVVVELLEDGVGGQIADQGDRVDCGS